jgi:hypothetical protein
MTGRLVFGVLAAGIALTGCVMITERPADSSPPPTPAVPPPPPPAAEATPATAPTNQKAFVSGQSPAATTPSTAPDAGR